MTARKPKGRRDYRPAPPREDDPLWWTKYVPCADEDDDRWDGEGFVNPRHEAARARAARWLARRGVDRHPFGWQPAMTVTPDGREVTDRDGVRAAQARGARGCFLAMLRPDVAAGLWRVSCWGGDDTSYVLRALTRAEAEAAWARLTPHVTVRTIRHVLRFGE